jgi:glycosyltransferase involved in cell wall biosynthesis
MRLSIITPSSNCEQYIDEALRSIDHQADEQTRHIVMDGGSTDARRMPSNATPGDGRHWIIESDRGQSHPRNKALQLSEGKIIGWLKADEFYLPNVFATVQRAFVAHPDVAIYGDVNFADGAGTV